MTNPKLYIFTASHIYSNNPEINAIRNMASMVESVTSKTIHIDSPSVHFISVSSDNPNSIISLMMLPIFNQGNTVFINSNTSISYYHITKYKYIIFTHKEKKIQFDHFQYIYDKLNKNHIITSTDKVLFMDDDDMLVELNPMWDNLSVEVMESQQYLSYSTEIKYTSKDLDKFFKSIHRHSRINDYSADFSGTLVSYNIIDNYFKPNGIRQQQITSKTQYQNNDGLKNLEDVSFRMLMIQRRSDPQQNLYKNKVFRRHYGFNTNIRPNSWKKKVTNLEEADWNNLPTKKRKLNQ